MMRRVQGLVAVTAVVVLVVGCSSGGSGSAAATDRVTTSSVTVVLRHPKDWRRQLSPQNRHYFETTARFANFDLHDPCTPTNNGQGISCHDELIGTFPQDGVLVTIGRSSERGPGPHSVDEVLAHGSPTTVSGHRAAAVQGSGQNCEGTGATHSSGYLIDTGATGTVVSVTFCWRGDTASVATQVEDAAASLVVEQ